MLDVLLSRFQSIVRAICADYRGDRTPNLAILILVLALVDCDRAR